MSESAARARRQRERGDDVLPLGRLEAFSDAVFAIAITILVLELGVEANADDHLLSSILDQWPSYLAYVTSFLTIGVVWIQHSSITGVLQAADRTLYRLNVIVLLLASFLPFPTKLLAEYIGERDPERVAAVFYGLTLIALSLALIAFARYATEHAGLARDPARAEAVRLTVTHSSDLSRYAVGIVVSLLVPTAGVLIYLVSSILRGLPTRALRQLLLSRRR